MEALMSFKTRRLAPLAAVVAVSAAAILISSQLLAAPQSEWRGCCGVAAWPQAPAGSAPGSGMMGGGIGMMGSMPRNHAAMVSGVPAPYANLHNPLPRTTATIDRGAQVYSANCASCHGPSGYGDGPAAQNLNPRPANLAWLSRMPMSRWDAFMYWTVSEGGAPFGTAMPSFKTSLSSENRWAAIAYIQARLPTKPAR
jgi:mono/diheme cytochrome c family protein